jgi:hypothetical protein
MYLNMFAALLVVAVLTSLLYTDDSSPTTGEEAMEAAKGAIGADSSAGQDDSIMQDYRGNVVVTEQGSPMLRGVQESLQRADAVMLKQNEIHQELIEEARQ